MTVKIPFAFTINGTTLPAGTYRVWRPSAETGTYLIGDGRGDKAGVTSAVRLKEPSAVPARLVFRVRDGAYFLAQIWMPTTDVGTELAAPRPEARAERSSAADRLVTLIAER